MMRSQDHQMRGPREQVTHNLTGEEEGGSSPRELRTSVMAKKALRGGFQVWRRGLQEETRMPTRTQPQGARHGSGGIGNGAGVLASITG